MKVSLGVGLSIKDVRGEFCLRVLPSLRNAGLEPAACAAILEEAIASEGVDPAWFDLDAVRRGGVGCREEFLFPTDIPLIATGGGDEVPLGRDRFAETASWIRDFYSGRTADASKLGELTGLPADVLIGPSPRDALRATWPGIKAPGVYRRDHASVVIRSETTTIISDPITSSGLETLAFAPLSFVDDCPDAVVITHGHGDHWHLPSLLQVAGANTDMPVIVPHIPRVNISTPMNMLDMLDLCGQKALDPEWGESLRIGDIDIDILPFYGEQPTHSPPGALPGVRNWGNCYRFTTPQFSVIILADSGTDPLGSMADVAVETKKRRGPPDLVMACLRVFPCPFFGGLASYWASISFDRLQELWQQLERNELPTASAGPDGCAEFLRNCDARYFAPYAHGYEGVGREVTHTGWGWFMEGSEELSLQETENAVDAIGGATRVLRWTPGDSMLWNDGDFKHVPYSGELDERPSFSVPPKLREVGIQSRTWAEFFQLARRAFAS